MSEVVNEFKFIHNLLRDIGFEVNFPVVVKTHNVGAMFMVQNSSSRIQDGTKRGEAFESGQENSSLLEVTSKGKSHD
jgi:hypothetical protein